jgi:hypothetical protein
VFICCVPFESWPLPSSLCDFAFFYRKASPSPSSVSLARLALAANDFWFSGSPSCDFAFFGQKSSPSPFSVSLARLALVS